MIIISAMTRDRVIGRGERMPWNIPDEYAQYLRFVEGQTVIMGRRTYDVFAQDLSDTTTPILVTRSGRNGDALTASSLEEALQQAKQIGKTTFVAGGSSIYGQAIPLADEMYLSTIKESYTGDAYFPEFNVSEWEIAEQSDAPQFIFTKYRRTQPS